MTLVEELRWLENRSDDPDALRLRAADRIEALELRCFEYACTVNELEAALREIALHLEAHPHPSQRTDNALTIARAALEGE